MDKLAKLFGRTSNQNGDSDIDGESSERLRTSAKFLSEYDELHSPGSRGHLSNGNGYERSGHDNDELLGSLRDTHTLTDEERAVQNLGFDTESELEKKQRKRSLLVVNAVMFIQALQFSTFVSAIWPLLQEVEPLSRLLLSCFIVSYIIIAIPSSC